MNDIVLAILSAVSGGGIAGLVAVLQRRKLIESQANKLDAEAYRITYQTLTEAMESLRNDYGRLSHESELLKKEIDKLKREQGRLKRAIEKINNCPSKDACPVTRELQSNNNKNETP